jgi:hypothetical protein
MTGKGLGMIVKGMMLMKAGMTANGMTVPGLL